MFPILGFGFVLFIVILVYLSAVFYEKLGDKLKKSAKPFSALRDDSEDEEEDRNAH